MWKLWKTAQPEGADKGLKQRVTDVEEQLEKLEATIEGLRIEWATEYKKFSRLAGHITKSAAIDARQSQEVPVKPRSIDDLTRDEIARLPLPWVPSGGNTQ